MCSADDIQREEVLNLVASLVNKSILARIQATQHTTAWYQMLETVRQYGAARLDEDELRGLRVRHRDHYRSLAQQYDAEGFGAHQADWFIRLRREQGNVRAALEFCLLDGSEAAVAFDIAAPTWNFWFAGFLREGYRYLLQALDLAPEPTRAGRTRCGPPATWPCSRRSSTATPRCWPSAARSPRGSTTAGWTHASRSAVDTRRSTKVTRRAPSPSCWRPARTSGRSATRSASSTR